MVGCTVVTSATTERSSQFDEVPVRNVSTPAFPVTEQPASTQQQQQLARTTEVENIPQQLTVRPSPDMVLTYQRCVVLLSFHSVYLTLKFHN